MESERESALVLVAERLPEQGNVLSLVEEYGAGGVLVLLKLSDMKQTGLRIRSLLRSMQAGLRYGRFS